jgi:hypothetical protein
MANLIWSAPICWDMLPADHKAIHQLWWQEKGLSYTASGYGAKIPSARMVYIDGRWRRVYVTQYGNAGSAWILVKGVKVSVI